MSQTKAQLIDNLVQALNFTGTASAPANGVFLSATNTLALATNSAQRLTIDSSGRLGIGTTSPNTKLDVRDPSATGISSRSTTTQATDTNKGLKVRNNSDTDTFSVSYKGQGYFAGNVGIGTTSPDVKLDVARLGTAWTGQNPVAGTAVHFHNGNNATTSPSYLGLGAGTASISGINFGDADDADIGKIHYSHSDNSLRLGTNASERMRIDSSGRLLVGTTSSRTVGGNTQKILQIETTNATAGIAITRNSDTSTASMLSFGKSRGTSNGTSTIVQSNDQLGRINFCGADGTDAVTEAAKIEAFVDGTPGSNDMPGRLVFSTTADGAASPTERMRIDSSGKVGIGTASPTANLHLKDGSSNTEIKLQGGSSTANDIIAFLNSAGSTRGNITYDTDNNFLLFNVNTSERMRIDSSGRVGIGTSSPTQTLDVTASNTVGIAQFTNTATSFSNSCYTVHIDSSAHTSNMTAAGAFAVDVNAGRAMTIDGNGKVGIGTSSPDAPLTIHNSSDPEIRFGYNSTQDHRISWDGSKVFIHADPENANGSSALGLAVDGTTRLYITDAGNVGIGTISPSERLSITNASGSGAQMQFRDNGTGTTSSDGFRVGYNGSGGQLWNFENNYVRFATNNTERVRILNDGAVCINATARPVVGTEKLGVQGGGASNAVGIGATVSHNQGIPFFASNGSNTTSQRLMRFAAGSGGDTRGTITFNGSVMVYGGASDYRLKENITSISNGITKLKDLKPINFNWIKDETNTSIMGFLAHEVQEVMPQVVVGTKDEVNSEGKPEYQEIDLGGISPLIVAALQEAISKIETLETKVAALEAA